MKFRPLIGDASPRMVLVCSLALAQTNGQPERFTSNAVSLSTQYGTGQQTVEINGQPLVTLVRSRERLIAALMKRPDELVEATAEDAAGRHASGHPTPSATTSVTRNRRRCPKAGGASSSRPIGRSASGRRQTGPRSIDYPFTVIQMNLDQNGMGSGTHVLRHARLSARQQRHRAGGLCDAADHAEQHPRATTKKDEILASSGVSAAGRDRTSPCRRSPSRP